MKMIVHVLNTTILPTEGVYSCVEISLDQARGLVSGANVISHVGHAAAAALCTELLGVKVACDREPWQGNGAALALKVNGRPPAGAELDRADLDRRGYTWRLVQPLACITRHRGELLVAGEIARAAGLCQDAGFPSAAAAMRRIGKIIGPESAALALVTIQAVLVDVGEAADAAMMRRHCGSGVADGAAEEAAHAAVLGLWRGIRLYLAPGLGS